MALQTQPLAGAEAGAASAAAGGGEEFSSGEHQDAGKAGVHTSNR